MTNATYENVCVLLDADELAKHEAAYREAQQRAEELRAARNAAVREALDEGMPQTAIAQATGLTRGRINQLRERPE